MNAAVNDVFNGRGPSFDIQGYDVIKCFDEMWYEETLNDLWDVKIQNDKFALISRLEEKCKIVVKIARRTTGAKGCKSIQYFTIILFQFSFKSKLYSPENVITKGLTSFFREIGTCRSSTSL